MGQGFDDDNAMGNDPTVEERKTNDDFWEEKCGSLMLGYSLCQIKCEIS